MKLYVSGPITNELSHKENFNKACRMLQNKRYETLDPHDVLACSDKSCINKIDGNDHSYACYLKYDIIAMLKDCDGVAMISNWEYSVGAKLERHVARNCGLEVRSVEEWLSL